MTKQNVAPRQTQTKASYGCPGANIKLLLTPQKNLLYGKKDKFCDSRGEYNLK